MPQYRAAVLGGSVAHEVVHSGNVILDGHGNGTVALTAAQAAVLETGARSQHVYTLTAVGASAPGLHVAREVEHDAERGLSFAVAGGKSGLKVSWVLRSFAAE